MTSRVSYCRMLTNAMRRRIWYGASMMLLFFLALPLRVMLQFESVQQIMGNDYLTGEEALTQVGYVRKGFVELLGGGDFIMVVVIIMAALLGAWSGLYWLHSKRKMDMIGSLPVRREKLFFTDSINTLILFAVPFVINMLLSILIGAAKDIMTQKAALYSLAGVGIAVLFFITIYLCAAVAMLLCGKILTGILGTLVFLSVLPVLHAILNSLPGMFWSTYVRDGIGQEKLMYLESPATAYFSATKNMLAFFEGYTDKADIFLPILAALGMIAVFAGVCVWMIRIRPAEGAEQSLVFPKTEGIIKACILYVMALGGGLFFRVIGFWGRGNEKGEFWFWFGIIFTLLLMSILIEVIYSFDRKRIFDHKLWTGVAAAAAVLTAGFFAFDLIKYDTWLPSEDEVAHAVVNTRETGFKYPDGSYGISEYLQNHIEEFGTEGILELAENGIENIDNSNLEDGYYVTVLYQMKNGTVKKRSYTVEKQVLQTALETLYQTETYKQARYPMLLVKPEEMNFYSVSVMGQWLSVDALSQNDQQELLTLYQQDLMELSYDEIYMIGSNRILVQNRNGGDAWEQEYPLNDNFVRSINFLKEKGIPVDMKIDEVDIQSLTFYDYRDESDYTVAESGGVTISDREDIEKARKGMVSRGGYEMSAAVISNMENQLEVEVIYTAQNGDPVTCYCWYEKGKVPEYVEQLLKEPVKEEKEAN
jgi:ABC-2 type transport system permease protein